MALSDMAKARAFYEGFFGFQSPFSIPRPKGGDLAQPLIHGDCQQHRDEQKGETDGDDDEHER